MISLLVIVLLNNQPQVWLTQATIKMFLDTFFRDQINMYMYAVEVHHMAFGKDVNNYCGSYLGCRYRARAGSYL